MKPVKGSSNIAAIGFILIVAAVVYWGDRRPTSSLPTRSIIAVFVSTANGRTVELRVGVSYSCDLISNDDCLLDQLIEVWVDTKLVSAIGTEQMSPLQNRAMRYAILSVLPQQHPFPEMQQLPLK